jgi:hypothetical protein
MQVKRVPDTKTDKSSFISSGFTLFIQKLSENKPNQRMAHDLSLGKKTN